MVVPRYSALLLILTSLLLSPFLASAAVNPFKKTKDYQFSDSVAWYFKDGAAIKSGSEPDGGDILYYHLNINKNQLRLRFGKNDPSGELENTRVFDDLEIIDVTIDGQRLNRFQWCLDNQSQLTTTLKQNSIVANGACVNSGGGDFTIGLDDETRDQLKKARTIEFIASPYGRPVRLTYTMSGFAKGYAAIIAPPPPAPAPVPAPVVEAAKPDPKPEPKQVVKTCYAEAPDDMKGAVKSIAYLCDDKAKKTSAEATIQSQVATERRKQKEVEAERQRAEASKMKEEAALKTVESEWDKRQTEIWVERCQKHWTKGVSPCYCAPYIDKAPAGVENTCGK
ncbi:MAG: hypothetical protein HYZ31_05425 [Gammaproteobacteria bacterium]|nr:hypothetical protein [Gammaproteobacteria bacterium]